MHITIYTTLCEILYYNMMFIYISVRIMVYNIYIYNIYIYIYIYIYMYIIIYIYIIHYYSNTFQLSFTLKNDGDAHDASSYVKVPD